MSVAPAALPRDFSKRPGARMFWGAVALGTLAGVYQLTSGLVNSLLIGHLRITLDLGPLLATALFSAVAGALVGAVTMRPDGAGTGVLVGAATFGVLTSVIWSATGNSLGGFLAFVVLAPATAVGLAVCTALRFALSGRLRRGLWVWLGAALLGIFGGYWSHLSSAEIAGIELVQSRIQTFATQPQGAETPLVFVQAPNLSKHARAQYSFAARTVESEPVTIEVTVTFDDGYSLSCLVVGKTPRCSEFGRTELGGPSSGP